MKNRDEILAMCRAYETVICRFMAYEHAFGYALQGKLRDNPYTPNSEGFIAYEQGQEEGSQEYYESYGRYPIKE